MMKIDTSIQSRCGDCGDANFVKISRPLSQKDKRSDQEQCIFICKTCDPLMASLSLLRDGYEIALKTFSKPKNNKGLIMKKIIDFQDAIRFAGRREYLLLPKYGGSWVVEKVSNGQITLKKRGSQRRRIFTSFQFDRFSEKQGLFMLKLD